MAHADSDPEEAITKDEIQVEPPPRASRNAFTELMTPKPKPQPKALPTPGHAAGGRMGLGEYLSDPSLYPSSQVIYHNDDFVLINDKFPKATIHCLLLPRSRHFTHMHPFDAMDDPKFRGMITQEVVKVKDLVAKELQRRLGPFSRSEAHRESVLNGEAPPPPSGNLPQGRDWASEIKVGFHAQPSMSHLHVHIFSRDMHSPCLKHKKHYNSFNTPFLVPLEDFPLDEHDERRGRKSGWLNGPMRCWRCGKVFEKSFVGLKEHLENEFEDWRRT